MKSTAAPPYRSLAALEEAHFLLLDQYQGEDKGPTLPQQIRTFLPAIGQTGGVLAERKDRFAAQRMIDFWSSVLYQLEEKPPRIRLDAWDPSQVEPLKDSDFPYTVQAAFHESPGQPPIGWTMLLHKCLTRLQSGKRLVTVIGPPRGGRTFLMHEGLIPRLKQGALEGSERWHYVERFVPSSSALADLERVLSRVPPGATMALAIDNFEKLFSHCDPKTQRAFIQKILSLIPQHVVLLTMRSDRLSFLSDPALADLVKHVQDGAVRIEFDTNALRQIILQPAERIDLKFADDRLVDRIIQDVQGDPEAMQLLLFSMRRLWKFREGNAITWESYNQAGAGRSALAKAAEQLYRGLSRDEQSTLRAIFLRLIRVKASREIVFESPSLASLAPGCGPQEQVTKVVALFESEGLFRVTQGTNAGAAAARHAAQTRIGAVATRLKEQVWGRGKSKAPNVTTVSLAQESLVGCWPVLEIWIQEERHRLGTRKKIIQLSAIALGVVAVLGAWTGFEHYSNRQLNLSFSNILRYEGIRRLKLEDDASAVFLYSMDALDLLEKNRVYLSAAELEARRRDHHLQLGVMLRRQPELVRIRHQKEQTITLLSPGKRWLALAAKRKVEIQELDEKAASVFLSPTHGVDAILFSRDEEFVVTAGLSVPGEKPEVVVWQRATGQEVRRLGAHEHPVTFLAATAREVAVVTYSPKDGKRELTLWDLKTGAPLKDFSKEQPLWGAGALEHPVFGPERSSSFAVAVNDRSKNKGVVKLVDWASGKSLSLPEMATVNHLTFDGPGLRLAVAAGSPQDLTGEVRIHHVHDGQERLRERHDGAVLHVAFSPDGKRLASTSTDTSAHIWDLQDRYADKRLSHQSWVFKADFSPDSQYLVTAARDQKARVWDAATGVLMFPPLNHSGTVGDATFGPDGQHVYTSSQESFHVWKLTRNEWRSQALPTPGSALSTFISDDGSRGVLVSKVPHSRASEVRVWSLTSPAPPQLFEHGETVRLASISPKNQRYLVTVQGKNQVRIVDLADGEKPGWDFAPSAAKVNAVIFSPNGNLLLTVAGSEEEPGEAKLWNVEKREQHGAAWHHGPASLGVFSPSGKHVATVKAKTKDEPAEMKVRDVAGDVDVATIRLDNPKAKTPELRGHIEEVLAIEFHPRDEDILATASKDDSACLWSVAKAALLHSLRGHRADVTRVAFNHDGAQLVTASLDLTAMLWDTSTGKRRAILEHESFVTDAFFAMAPEFPYVVTISADGVAWIWEPRHGELVVALKHAGKVAGARFQHKEKGYSLLTVSFLELPVREAGEFAQPPAPYSQPIKPARPVHFRQAEFREWDISPLPAGARDKLRDIGFALAARKRLDKSLTLERLPAAEVAVLFAKQHGEYAGYRQRFALHDSGIHALEAGRNELVDRWEVAKWHVDRLLKDQQDNPELLRRAAELLSKLGRPREAFELDARIVKLGKYDWRMWKRQGEHYRFLGSWEKAEDAYTQALRHSEAQRDGELWQARALTFLARADNEKDEKERNSCFAKAMQDYAEAIRLRALNPELYVNRAAVLEKMAVLSKDDEKYRDAAADYKEALSLNPAQPHLWRRQAVMFDKFKNFDGVYRSYSKAAELYLEGVRPQHKEGAECLELALSAADSARAPVAEKVQLRLELARVYAEHLQQIPRAVSHLAEIRKAPVDDARVLKKIAEYYLNHLLWDQAVKVLDDLVALEPTNMGHRFDRARANSQLANPNFKKVVADLTVVLKHNPRDWAALEQRARAWSGQQEWANALADYDTAINQEPKNDMLYAGRAEVHAEKGDWDLVANDLGKAIDLFPRDTYAWYRRAVALLMKGDRAGYQQLCDDMAKTFSDANDSHTVNELIWTHVLAAQPHPENLKKFESLATQRLNLKNFDHLNTLGSWQFRAGDWQKAVQTLEKTRAERRSLSATPDPVKLMPGEAGDLLFLAMAHHRLNETKKANEYLAAVVNWLKAEAPESISNVWGRAELQLFRQEVETLLHSAKK